MSRDREHDAWIPWYLEDTAGWLGLSLMARGAAAEIARKMGQRRSGDLPLTRGLSSLAVLLHVAWSDLEPAIAELVADGRLTWDGASLVDPQWATRQRRSSADRMRDKRARDSASLASHGVTSRNTASPSTSRSTSDLDPDLGSDLPPSAPTPPPIPESQWSGEYPDWFHVAIDVIAMNTGVALPVGEAWLRYGGARHNNARGIAVSQPDAQQWLATVMVPEARELLRVAARDKDRDKAFAQRGRAQGPEPPPKLTKQQSEAFAEQLAARMGLKSKVGT